MTNRIKPVVLVLSGVVIGCGAAAGMKASWAGPTPGKWSCYDPWEFPDVEVNQKASDGMNKIAARAPAGTTLVIKSAGGANAEVICVRD